MTPYMLVLLMTATINNAPAMAVVPGFTSKELCESAGEAWRVLAKWDRAYYYCIPAQRS